MSKYFVRYSYKVSGKVPDGSGLGWKFETLTLTESCICEMVEENLTSVYDVQKYIHDYELNYMSNRPDYSEIDIIAMNKL